jgi:hypothetical protein
MPSRESSYDGITPLPRAIPDPKPGRQVDVPHPVSHIRDVIRRWDERLWSFDEEEVDDAG